jgi:hypothetical protein
MKLDNMITFISIAGLFLLFALAVLSPSNEYFYPIQANKVAQNHEGAETIAEVIFDIKTKDIASLFSNNTSMSAAPLINVSPVTVRGGPIKTQDIKYIGMIKENGETWYFFRDIRRGKIYKLKPGIVSEDIVLKLSGSTIFILTIEGVEYFVN